MKNSSRFGIFENEKCLQKNALKKLGDTGRPVIYEDTGKNCDRILKRGLPPFMDKGYKLTVVFVDNIPEIAIARASQRFQRTGRYSADDSGG